MTRPCRFLTGLIGAALLWINTAPAIAATNATPKLQPERWLLVVDTADKMSPRAQAVRGVIGEMLASGINGQLNAGDQIGIWTFDKELRAGIAPLQTWNPGQSNMIAGRTARFIGDLKFKGKSELNSLVPELKRVVKESRRLTVLVFSDASHTISGTPYDAELNAAYEAHRAEQSATRMPLVTVIRSERGKLIGQSVSFAPWLDYPKFTPDPVPKPVEKTKAPEPRKSIIIGGEPKPTQPVTPTSNELIVSTAQPAVEIPATSNPQTKPVEVPAPQPVTAAVIPPATLANNVAATTTSPRVVETTTPTSAPQPEATISEPAAVAPAATSPGPIQDDGGFLSRKWLLILGLGCMWVAIVMALLLVRRSRRTTGASLITRSFDRNQR